MSQKYRQLPHDSYTQWCSTIFTFFNMQTIILLEWVHTLFFLKDCLLNLITNSPKPILQQYSLSLLYPCFRLAKVLVQWFVFCECWTKREGEGFDFLKIYFMSDSVGIEIWGKQMGNMEMGSFETAWIVG